MSIEHTSAGPATLSDEACVLTAEEWWAVQEVVVWAWAQHKTRAQLDGDRTEYEDAVKAAAALAILRGTKERTHRSHHPLTYPPCEGCGTPTELPRTWAADYVPLCGPCQAHNVEVVERLMKVHPAGRGACPTLKVVADAR